MQHCFDLAIALAHQLLEKVPHLDRLIETEQLLIPIVPCQRLSDLSLGFGTPRIAHRRQLHRIALSLDDVSQNLHPRRPGDIADRLIKSEIHQRQSLLHPLDLLGALLGEVLAMTHVPTQLDHQRLHSYRWLQDAEGVQQLDPLAIDEVALLHPVERANRTRVDQNRMQAVLLINLVRRYPVHTRRFDGHFVHANRDHPFGRLSQLRGRRAELSNRLLARVVSHADPDRVRPDIGSCRVVVELVENSIILGLVPGSFLLAHTLLLNSMCEPCREISMHALLSGTESMLFTSLFTKSRS